MNNNKTYYTAADYSRYHSGVMDAAEMHAMEKAALQDPFVQDALDGYVHTKTGEADVELLRNRLKAFEKKDAVIVSGSFKSWWKIAAVFLIAATVSFLIYNSSNNEVTPQLAEVKTNEIMKPDTGLTNEIAQSNPATSMKDDVVISDGIGEKGDEIVVLPRPEAAPVVKNVGKDIVELKAVQKVGANYKLDGTIVSDNGLPIANASIVSEDKKLLAKTDDKGKYEFETRSEELSTTISTEGYEQRKKTLDANQSSTVVLKEQTQMSNAPNNAAKTKAIAQAPIASNNIAQPVNGWDDYNQYLKESTAVVYNEAGVKQSGTVFLNFEIDKKGTPEKIAVKKSDCSDCNLAAIQVLKDGPKWSGKSGVVNEINIKF